jgi:uncharacterized membrane protein
VPSSERRRRWLLIGAAAAALGAIVVAYPLLLDALLARFGVRGTASGLLGLALVSMLLGGRRAGTAVGVWPGVALASLLGMGALTGNPLALLLVPALVYLTLAAVFRASLARPDSIIERCARLLVPQAPDFIRSYCRAVTGLWVVFFAASAGVIAGLALSGHHAGWRAVTSWMIYAMMIGITAIEFLVRKTRFRYYFHGGPFDRLWARIFPAQNTARGRRSAESIRRFREEMAAGNGG